MQKAKDSRPYLAASSGQGPAGVADGHQAFADLLDPYPGAAAGNRNFDCGIECHDPLGRFLHHGDVGRAAGEIQVAGKPLEPVQFIGTGGRAPDQGNGDNCDPSNLS